MIGRLATISSSGAPPVQFQPLKTGLVKDAAECEYPEARNLLLIFEIGFPYWSNRTTFFLI
jgi:hypothetical protein